MSLLPKKGSVLVFSLIILSIILSAAITVATVSITNQRSASSTGKSVQSFQVADSGIELALQKIYKGSYSDLNAMATAMGGGASCAGGTISKNNVVGGNIKVSFYDNDGNLVTCAATDWRDKVVRIKSEGSAFGTTRVVETAVAAAGLSCVDYSLSSGPVTSTTCESSSLGSGAVCTSLSIFGLGLNEWFPRPCNSVYTAPHNGHNINLRCCK